MSASSKPVVAIDIGWRNVGNQHLRVAYLLWSNGFHAILELPPRIMGSFAYVDSIQSEIDKKLNAIVDLLKAGSKDHKNAWLKAELRYAHTWKTAAHVAKLVKAWPAETSSDLLVIAEAFLKKNRHLVNMKASLMGKTINRRNEIYKLLSKVIAKNSSAVILEKMELDKLSKKKKKKKGKQKTEDDFYNSTQRWQKNKAANGVFRDSVKAACSDFYADRAKIIEIDPAGTSSNCPWCETSWNDSNQKSSITKTCNNCNKTLDRDEAAVINMLKKGLGPAALQIPRTEPLKLTEERIRSLLKDPTALTVQSQPTNLPVAA